MSSQTEMKVISTLLDIAMEHDLEIEVIFESLKIMSEDNTLTPSQAFKQAADEWIKE